MPFCEAHRAKSWNNLNLIWFWFSGNQLNAPELEIGGPPLGHGENNNVSNDDIVTVAGASSAAPPCPPGGAHKWCAGTWNSISAYNFLLTTSNSSLYNSGEKWGEGEERLSEFSCDNRPVHNNNLLKLSLELGLFCKNKKQILVVLLLILKIKKWSFVLFFNNILRNRCFLFGHGLTQTWDKNLVYILEYCWSTAYGDSVRSQDENSTHEKKQGTKLVF